jgi:hypothetical protein
MPILDAILKFLTEFGLTKGLFALSFIGGHLWIYRLYSGRLKDRQKQIDMLAKDNHEYRDRLLQLLDKHFANSRPPSQGGQPPTINGG